MARAGALDEAATSCPQCRVEVPATAVFCPHCGSSTIPARGTTPVLPGYSILRTLGRGGAAVVYLARQESLDREVAVKVLRRDVEDPKVWREFRREAHTIARLSSHPHVVTVYTAGRSAAGQPYLVTEYLDRGSLAAVIDTEGPQDAVAVATVGVAMADALTAAHGLGILHRDVKPGNVLLAHDGRIKLGDFGIARLLVGQSNATTDQIAFTPEHVAPELLRNEPDGPWSDVYGLASTLAAALVGVPLFRQRPDERMESFLTRKVLAPPPDLGPRVPAVLAEPLTRALDPQPSRRPSVMELRHELAATARALGSPVPLPPLTPTPTPPPPPPVVLPTGSVTARPQTAPRSTVSPARPGTGDRRRPRRDRFPLVLSALFAALAAIAVVIALLATDGDGQEAVATTGPISAAPTAAAAAPPSPAPTPAVTSPPSAAPTVAPTTPPTAPTAPAPATKAAPPTTVATVPAAKAAPATSPPPLVATAPVEDATGLVTPAQAESFVRDYFDAVAVGDYERSWSQLTPEFQRGRARSYDYYTDFWDDNDITVGNVVLVDADPGRAFADVELRWNGGDAFTERFELRAGPNGELLIADQHTVG